MDAPNSTPDQEKEGEQQPSPLPIVCEKDNSQEASNYVPPQVSKAAQLPMLLLTVAALSLATGSGKKTYLGCRAISTYSEGASRPRTRRSQVRLSRGSTCRTPSTPMGVVRVQTYRWREARAEQSNTE
jgi:hypothetical protein